jgi:hypothetical protein
MTKAYIEIDMNSLRKNHENTVDYIDNYNTKNLYAIKIN